MWHVNTDKATDLERKMSNEQVERVLREHVLSPATGGTATGSTWRCSCGASETVDSVRDYANVKGRRHLAQAILTAIAPAAQVAETVAELRTRIRAEWDSLIADGNPDPFGYEADPYGEEEFIDLLAYGLHPTPDVDVIAGDTQPGCTGDYECPAPAHQHGCMTDTEGHCNEPEEHPTPDADARSALATEGRARLAERDFQSWASDHAETLLAALDTHHTPAT